MREDPYRQCPHSLDLLAVIGTMAGTADMFRESPERRRITSCY